MFGCISRSKPTHRFIESQALSAPDTSAVSIADTNNYSFAVVGDTHIANADVGRFERILDGATAGGDSFLILLGDIVDKGDRVDFEALKTAISNKGWDGRVFYVIGNHDIFYDGWDNYKELLAPSFYSLEIANAKFIAMDSADGALVKRQEAWVKSEVEQSSNKFTFLMSHYLPIIPGQITYLRLSDQEQAERLMKIAENNNVTAWLGAHYHSFISDKVGDVQYVVAGGGGGRLMGPVKKNFYVQIQISGDTVTYTMKEVS